MKLFNTEEALLRIEGPDAEKFLQGQLTCDVRTVDATRTSLFAYCTVQGKVLVIGRLFFLANCYYLAIPHSLLTVTQTALAKYARFSKVTLADASHELMSVGSWQAEPTENLPLEIDSANFSEGLLYTRLPSESYRYSIYGPPTAFSTLSLADAAEWRLQNIEAGIPTLYPETSEQFTAHMLNLPALNAVSFEKGCYLGQEIIARTEHRGTTKRVLQQRTITSTIPLVPGHNLADPADANKTIVVDAVATAPDTYRALVVTAL